MNEKINLTKMDGSSIQADVICFLEVIATGKRFVFYTLNEVIGTDQSATVKIYVSKVKQDNPTLDTPISQEEWELFTKKVMKSTIQGVPCEEVKYIPLSELGNPVSVSDKAIAMPVFHDYINKHRGLYAQSVATAEVTAPTAPTPSLEQSQVGEPMAPVAPDTLTAMTTSEPALTAMPSIETPAAEAQPQMAQQPMNIFDNPAPMAPTAVEPAPMATPSATLEPQDTLSVQTPMESSQDDSSNSGTSAVLEPIDLASIEAKYTEMITGINKLMEQELEAAKRYNATIELSAMHKEQHASYVQNEQVKEVGPAPSLGGTAPSEPAIVESAPQPFAQPAAEPVPVTPVVPEPVPVTPQSLETNWFDMPNNQ